MSGHMIKITLGRLAGAGMALAIAGGAAPAMAQSAKVSYPASRSLNDLAAWLQRDTPLAPNQIVDVSPAALTAITSASPMGETRGFLANISSEAVDPDVLSHEGIASWSIPVEVDCEKRQVRLGAMTGFQSRDLRTDPRVVREADTSWVSPIRTAPLGAVIRALCDHDFRRPLAGKGKPTPPEPKIASAAPPPSAPASRQPDAARPALRSTLTPPASTVPAAAAKPKSAPAGGGSFTVQIGASPSKPDTEALLARFKKKYAAEMGALTANVASLEVDGKPVNRALITGFGSAAEAGAFCKTLSASGQACFIRR
jgi:cell division septation protein DedD